MYYGGFAGKACVIKYYIAAHSAKMLAANIK